MPQRPQLGFLEAVDDESVIAASAAPTRSTLANSGCAPVGERWDGSGNFVECGLAPTALPLVLSANLGDVCTPIPHFPPSYSYLHSKAVIFFEFKSVYKGVTSARGVSNIKIERHPVRSCQAPQMSLWSKQH